MKIPTDTIQESDQELRHLTTAESICGGAVLALLASHQRFVSPEEVRSALQDAIGFWDLSSCAEHREILDNWTVADVKRRRSEHAAERAIPSN